MKQNFNKVEGLLLDDKLRQKGSAEINGKTVEWESAYQIVILPFGDTKGNIRKYSVLESECDRIKSILEEINWGTYVCLEFAGNKVSDVAIYQDWYASYNQIL